MQVKVGQQLLSGTAVPTPRAAVARAGAGQQQGCRRCQTAAVGEFFKDLFDMNSWAPKSTRIWRMQQYQPPEARTESDSADTSAAEGLQDLQARINQMKDSQGPSSSRAAAGVGAGSSSSSWSASAGLNQRLPDSISPGEDELADPTGSFSDAEDSEVSAALSRRIKQIATTTGEWGSSMDEEEMRQPLSGEEIRQLLITKYGKQYDMSFVRRNLPGMGPCVSLNIMWLHADQASFKMTPQQYQDKLDSVAQLVNVLGQTDKVRAFLKAPARSMKGLPRRPVVGTAISIRLDLDKAQISEWFGQGYD